MKLPRFAPLSGIAFVVLLILGFGPVGGNTPGSDDCGVEDRHLLPRPQAKEIVAA